MVESQAQRVAQFKRRELIEAAVVELAQSGWSGLQMKAVAQRAGVSRTTVYNSFGGLHGLAEALVEHLTDSFLDGFEVSFFAEREPAKKWTAGIAYILRRGLEDPALRAMLGADGGDRFLQLLTSRSAPLVNSARARIAAVARADDERIEPDRAEVVAELVTRMGLSNIVQPMDAPEMHTAALAAMVTDYLRVDMTCATAALDETGLLVGTSASSPR